MIVKESISLKIGHVYKDCNGEKWIVAEKTGLGDYRCHKVGVRRESINLRVFNSKGEARFMFSSNSDNLIEYLKPEEYPEEYL